VILSLLNEPEAAIAAATEAIVAGECIVIPTDTVYGLAADATSPVAVQRLLDIKGRGRNMPPPVLIPDADILGLVATNVSDTARRLADAFWPGALTMILKSRWNLDLGDQPGTVAVRVPDHQAVRQLLRSTGLLAVSSANLTGCPPATTVGRAYAMLRRQVSVYIHDEPTTSQTPSTIVDLVNQPRIIRQGVISEDSLRAVCPELSTLTGIQGETASA